MYIEINNMHSRNKFNLSPDKRTYSVTLENRQNILENSSLIFPLISNSNTYNKKFNTIEADNYGIKFHSSCKPNCFKDIQRRKIDNKLFLDRYDDLKNGRLKNNKYLETLEAKENFKKNKSFCLPYTNKNLSLLETKHKPVDSFSILKECKFIYPYLLSTKPQTN